MTAFEGAWSIAKMPPNRYGEQPTRTTYMVNDDVWEEARGEGLDTIDELEEKLGRKLTPTDFPLMLANTRDALQIYSEKLWPKEMETIYDRMGGLEAMKERTDIEEFVSPYRRPLPSDRKPSPWSMREVKAMRRIRQDYPEWSREDIEEYVKSKSSIRQGGQLWHDIMQGKVKL